MNRDVGPVTAYADAVDGGYPGTREQFRTLLANLPHGVFFATYGTTTYADMLAAYNAGLYLVAERNDKYYPMMSATDGFVFGALGDNYGLGACLKCSTAGVWTFSTSVVLSEDVSYEGDNVQNVRDALNEIYATIGSQAPGVFYATYNSTSYADVKAAYDAGLFVVAVGDNTANGENIYVLEHNEKRLANPFFRFVCVKANGVIVYLTVASNNSWYRSEIDPAFAFFATYGVTTYDAIVDALSEGKIVFATDGELTLPCVGDLGGGFLFSGITTDTARTWTLADDDAWTHYETDIPAGAGDLSYSNTTSGLSAYNVQEAIDEVKSLVDEQDVMIVKATATWLGGALTGMSIDSGQTLAQIYSKAFDGANIVLIVSNKMYLAYARTGNAFAGGSVTFSRIGDNSIEAFTLSRTSLPYVYSWTYGKSELQLTGNLVTTISSDSTDTQYPSAKCVWDKLYALEQRVSAIE